MRRGASRRQRTARRAEALSQGDAKSPAPPSPPASAAPWPQDQDDAASDPASEEVLARGMWARLVALWPGRKKTRPDEQASVVPADDPVLRILAVPRGVARLHAFEELLGELSAGTHGHRSVGLAYARELEHLTRQAAVDLALLAPRLEVCARALEAAGLPDKAAPLWLRLGHAERARSLFAQVGDIAALEDMETSHETALAELGGTPRAAQAAFERAEALFDLGHRREGLASLEEAVRLAPGQARHARALAQSRARAVVARARFDLLREGALPQLSLAVYPPSWPRIIGRGEEADVQLAGPLISRAHVELISRSDGLFALDRSGRAGTTCDGMPLDAPRALRESGVLEVMGTPLAYAQSDDALTLRTLDGHRIWALLRAPRARLPLGPDLVLDLAWQAEGTLVWHASVPLALAGTPLRQPLLAWHDDLLEGPGFRIRTTGGFLPQPAGQADILE